MDPDQSKQTPRDYCDNSDGMCTSSLKEISLIESVTSFLAENGQVEVDPRVLKNLAEALSKRIDIDVTSPGGLHDGTMENSFLMRRFDAARAPGGIHSPMQGRSVRELEEQMSTLRKENFNLKLRIYFMDEGGHGGGTRGGAVNSTGESPTKQLIDSKIEIEVMRKEIEEKTNLLKDAARAISQHETMQRNSELESHAMIEQMQQYIHQLEEAAKQREPRASMDAMNAEKFKSLEADVQRLKNALLEADSKEAELKRQRGVITADLEDRQESLVACEAKIAELAIKNAELVEQLERQTQTDELANQTRLELCACLAENRSLLSELNSIKREMLGRNKCIEDAAKVFDEQRKSIKLLEDMNYKKDCAYWRLLIEHEGIIRKQSCDVDKMRREKQFFQELINKLQYRERISAAMQPMPRSTFSLISDVLGTQDYPRQDRKMLYFSMPELRTQLADKECELQVSKEQLAELERVYQKACRSIQKLMLKVSSQDEEINRYKKQQQTQQQQQSNDVATSTTTISPTAQQLHSQSDNESTAGLDISSGLKQRYEQQLKDQDELIKQLRADIKKKTANLQNLVNKELWEKNREVERLTKLLSSSQQQSLESTAQDDAITYTEAEFRKTLKRNKLLQRKVDVLLQRLQQLEQSSQLVPQLRQQLQSMQTDVELANKWRLECADVCAVLTNRLEELAGFLNSLLKHKDVLGVLAADRRHAMRRAVDRSLDLSKSLNMTLSVTGVSMADQSLAQLSKLSEILLYTDEHQTFNSLEDMQALGKEREKEKDKSKSFKERRSLPLALDNQSESEAWSEPDRKVSLARIGLEDTSNSLQLQQQQLSESDSEEQLQQQQQPTLPSSSQSKERSRLHQMEARLLEAQCQLVDADSRFKQEQLRVLELNQQLEQLQSQNQALQSDLRAIGLQEDQELIELQNLNELQTQQLQQLQLTYNTLQADSQITELELQEAQRKLLHMEEQHATSLEAARVELSQFKMEAAERLAKQQEILERDWVASSEHEELKLQLLDLQRSIEFYEDSEKDLKQTLVENELATRALKKQLDESTLQASKAIMERTKAYNDKLQLESRLTELKQTLTQLQEQQQQRLIKPINNSSDVSQSGYTSEEVVVPATVRITSSSHSSSNSAATGQRLNNPSPDLGIESDVGRVLSVELATAQRPLLKTVELIGEEAGEQDISPDTEDVATAMVASTSTAVTGQTPMHDCAKVEQENADLRRKLIRTKRAFEDTYDKLRVVNKAKAQVEKDIKNQILKTHNVLRNVRSNMENVL
ncbi:GH23115 [Drosophila grimshawi]|uniref:GH23115 n=1 Tax=Drosophila grimshawi TaxID=7222 RepID=B4JVG0_DROGR|nr:GH23115 [Drosophila grimshawi]